MDTGRSGAPRIDLILVYFYLSIADTETLTLVGDEMIKREIGSPPETTLADLASSRKSAHWWKHFESVLKEEINQN